MQYNVGIGVKTKALITTPIAIRAENCTAEAVQVPQTHYPASGCESQGDSSHDVPQLPDRDGEGRFLRSDEDSAVQVPTVRQALRRAATEAVWR